MYRFTIELPFIQLRFGMGKDPVPFGRGNSSPPCDRFLELLRWTSRIGKLSSDCTVAQHNRREINCILGNDWSCSMCRLCPSDLQDIRSDEIQRNFSKSDRNLDRTGQP